MIPSGPVQPEGPEKPPPGRPGASVFTIEGRATPALFVVGWLATIVGVGCVVVALLSGGRGAAAILALVRLVLLSIGLIAGAGSQGIERRTRGVAAYTGPSPVLVFAATIPLSLLGVVLLGIPMGLLGVPVDGPLGRLASVAVQAIIYIGVIRLLVVDTGALTWTEMGLRRPDSAAVAELLTGAAFAGPVILATTPVALILSQVLPVTPVSPLPPTGEITGFLIQLVAGAVIAPIGEEIMFRGFATTAWARSEGPMRALVRGALFFALVHVLTISGASAGSAVALAAVAFLTRIPVSLALGALFVRRRSVWAPLGLHATFNALLLIFGEVAARQT